MMPDEVGANSSPPNVNLQILDAVSKSTGFVFGPNAGTAPAANAGAAIAYEKVAQAAALAVQDATDYQRNILSISTVAQGKALAMMFAEKTINPYAEILLLAVIASIGAAVTAGAVDLVAAEVAEKFPKA
jgi:hypothetical protein